jgi:hypothetical protein
MAIHQQALRYGQRRLIRRASRTAPWIGTAIALVALGATIRRKGLLRGTTDSVLNAIPVFGGMKLLAEMWRGRDFIADRAVRS